MSRIILGARVSMLVAVFGVGFSLLIGCMVGLLSGYKGGRTDTVLMRLVDLQMSIPMLALALLTLFVLGPSLVNLIIVLAISRWPLFARVTRSMVLDLKNQDFVESARSIGCGQWRVIFRHVVPNLASPILVLATLESARMIIVEASLSFLGMGVQPPATSWGLILGDGRNYLISAWWIVTFSGAMIFIAALSWNLLAGTVRALADPIERDRWVMARVGLDEHRQRKPDGPSG